MGCRVFGDAKVYGNAKVRDAVVSGNTDWFIVGPIGSRNDFTTFVNTKEGIYVNCGCFWGSIDNFRERVQEVHEENEHGRAYLAAAEIASSRIKPQGK